MIHLHSFFVSVNKLLTDAEGKYYGMLVFEGVERRTLHALNNPSFNYVAEGEGLSYSDVE